MQDFRIDSLGFYKNRRGDKVEIKKKANNNPEMWVCRDALGYYSDGTVTGFSDRLPEFDIIAKWEEPQINSDNSKVNVNMLKRIEELESALREIVDKLLCNETYDSRVAKEIAKQALGENK